MANFTHHEPCPQCGSKDNLACYDDGSKWCFGCRYYIPPIGLIRLRNKFKSADKIQTKHGINLPEDATYQIQANHLEWLNQYGITRQEIIRYRLMSSKHKGLILPIYNKNEELVFFVNRPMQKGAPKSVDNGKKPFVVFTISKSIPQDTVILVEDYVSALKVARVTPCVPLFGSYVSLEAVRRLAMRFSRCRVWLDFDKSRESIRQSQRFSVYFKSGSSSIISEKDPKEYNEQEIKKYVSI